MAGRIAGITIEIGGDTSNLQKSLRGVDNQLKTTQTNLKDINKLLKLDPGNVELLTQKQKNLESAIDLTKKRLEELKSVNKDSVTPEQWDAIQREIIATEQSLKDLKQQYNEFGSVSAQVLKNAGQSMKDLGGKIEGVGQSLSGISGAAAAVGGGLLKLGYDAVQSADDLLSLSKQTGVSTDELQKMQYASEMVDVSVEDITGALRKLKPKITEDNKALASLGITTTNLDGSTRDVTEVFYESLRALARIPNETERDQVAMELFGKSADSLAGIIDDGGAALISYGNEAQNLGLILSGDTLESLGETSDTLASVKANLAATMGELGATIAQDLAPVLKKGAELIGKLTAKFRELTPEQAETILKIAGIVAAIAPAIILIGKLVSGIGSIISVLGTVIGVLGGPLTLAIGAVIAVGVLLYKNWDTVKATAITVKDAVVNAWENLKERVGSIIDTIKSKIDGFKDKFDEIKQKVSDAFERIKDLFNFHWSLPHISLPHFTVNGGKAPYGLGGMGWLPSISVQWYKKAYDNPVMFTSPTVIGTANGAKGFGDGSGAEIVMSLNKLQRLVGASSDITVNVYGTANQNVNELADAVQQRLVALQRQKEAVYA